MSKEFKKKLMPVGNLWKKTRDDGSEYLSGPFGDNCILFVFINKNKKNNKHPDCNVMIGEIE